MSSQQFNIKEELAKLPELPGVYLMHGPMDEVIYVGKAKVLKNRVRQYFQTSYKKSNKIRQMVSLIERFEYIVVDSELEALILESNLIKEYKPRYNTLLKDDKNYPYIKVTTNELYPRIISSRLRRNDRAKYFGPYASSGAVNEVIDLLKRSFKIRDCAWSFSEDHPRERACLNFHIKKCDAPCIGHISREEYLVKIDKCLDFLNGKYDDIVKELSRKMTIASDNLDFETAIEMRDLISSIQAISDRQKITANDSEDRDIVGMKREQSDAVVQIFFIREGKIIGRDHQFLDIDEEETDAEVLSSFLRQYYNGTPFIPKEIWLQCALADGDVIGEWLSAVRGKKVQIRTPQIGSKEKLVELAVTNAGILLARNREMYKNEAAKTTGAVAELQQIIGLEHPPVRIEAYDISNTSGALNVGSMVVYKNGRPKRNDYRKFRIRTIDGPNDYGSMQEMLSRRFAHGIQEMQENALAGKDNEHGSFSVLPDLILMDGGKGQMRIAEEVLESLGLSIPVCGMVKDDFHRTRALLFQGRELPLKINGEAFKLVTRIQDETHRFAIEYHRSLRSKQQVKSVLDDIKGVGVVRKKALLKHFKEMEKIKAASVEELAQCPHMDQHAAQAVYDFFQGQSRTST